MSAQSPAARVVRVAASPGELAAGLGEFVAQCARTAVAERGEFSLAVSGGSLPKVRPARRRGFAG